jgi:signal transduction histidine kinase
MVTTEKLLRYAGLLVWFLIVITQIASPDGWRNHIPIDDNLLRQAVVWVLLAIFACCYWVNTRDIPSSQTSPRVLVLLLIQFITALLVTSDLSFIVSAEAALVLRRRHAIYWLICQSVAMLLWGLFLVNFGTFHTITLMNKGDPNISFWITISYVITWQVFSFCGGWFVANEAISRKKVSRLNAQLLLAQSELAEKSRGEERLRISREIHDAIGHNLVALSLQLDLAERLSEPQKSSHLSTAKKLASQMLTEVRGVVGILREPQEIDLRLAVETLASNIPVPRIHSCIAADLPDLSAQISRTIWRCLQESVNNAVKHSHAANLRIDISKNDTALLITVTDDGLGCSSHREGNGLQGMRERLNSIGGYLSIESTAATGFTVKMTIPI